MHHRQGATILKSEDVGRSVAANGIDVSRVAGIEFAAAGIS
ncbi:MAG TPA: hypothetical protein VGQ91_08370 [Ideonella sp.]|jgi:hypothetical protein|nr:hypothetical protein [Ideonella sp.]